MNRGIWVESSFEKGKAFLRLNERRLIEGDRVIQTRNNYDLNVFKMAGWTGLEPAASGVTGRRYNQLNYHPRFSLEQRSSEKDL